MRLHKIPGAYVYGIFGGFGSGKTLFLVEQALEFAVYHRRSIAANFYLNESMIRLYAKKFDYDWLRICRIKHSLTFEELLLQENSILLLDEAGVEIFSRTWKSRKATELDALFRIRHYRNKLLYAAQEWSQVDVQFRNMTHLCVWCRGFQYFPPAEDPVLISRLLLYFNPHKFVDFISKPTNKVKVVYPLVQSGFRYSFDVIKAKKKYKYLFSIYNSFDSDRSRKKAGRKHQFIEYSDFNSHVGNNNIIQGDIDSLFL